MREGTDDGQTHVLLIEDNPRDARLVELALGQPGGALDRPGGTFLVTHVSRLDAAVALLSEGQRFGVALLDLQLPDSRGLETLSRLRACSATLPIVVLTGIDDDALAVAAIQQGAQDWLPKDGLDGRLLSRTIRHASERKRIEVELVRHAREVEAARGRIERQAAELRARAEQLDAINRELDDFTYIASHDLKEPLRGIRGYCEILLEDYGGRLEPQGVQRLEALVGMCDRLATQIDDLLTYCRLGRAENPRHAVDLGEVVQRELDTLQVAIEQRDATVEVLGALPVALGDATLIGTVLANLLSNALKYNESPRPCVQIGAVADEPCTIWVRDNGIGIEPRYHEEIFTLFRRLHGRKKYDGTGAGLTIVRKIVERLGGRIWLESEPGQGSTFYVSLPPAESPPPARHAPHWLAHPSSASR